MRFLGLEGKEAGGSWRQALAQGALLSPFSFDSCYHRSLWVSVGLQSPWDFCQEKYQRAAELGHGGRGVVFLQVVVIFHRSYPLTGDNCKVS